MKCCAFSRVFSLVLALIFLLSSAPNVSASAEGDQPKRAVLTYDDGPNGAVTSALLQVLAEEEVSATFFLCAYRIRQYPELVLQIHSEGHSIGIHGSSHQRMDALSTQTIVHELKDCIDEVTQITGQRVRYFRPPYGLTNSALEDTAAKLGVNTVLWNVDPEDWREKSAEKIAAGVLAQVSGESIILLHDLSMQSVYATRTIIRALRQQGYEFTTLDGL